VVGALEQVRKVDDARFRAALEADVGECGLSTGSPGFFASTLSRALSGRFGLPRFAKDDFKERMYDAAFDGDH
jgi:hypothetical protein